MAIYGTAALSICLIVGMAAGRLLGRWLGLGTNVGGVGIAMVLLVCVTGWMRRRDLLPPPSESGILFWSSIYIPVVVAMAATQNVRGAINGGPVAILTGALVVVSCFALLPVIGRIDRATSPVSPPPAPGDATGERPM